MGERVYGAAAVMQRPRTYSLSTERVLKSWSKMVERGAGHSESLMKSIAEMIKDASMPNIYCEEAEVTSGLFGEKRKYLVVNHEKLRNYRIFIGVRDYGIHLDASYFFTCEPRFLKRTLSKYTQGNPHALSQQIDVFSQQDLNAFTVVVEHTVDQALHTLYEELKLDPSTLNRESRGFLNAW